MSSSWWSPLAMLFLSPALTTASRSRSRGYLVRLLGADLIAIAIVIVIRLIEPGTEQWIGIFFMAALAALVSTGALLGGVLRFAFDYWYARLTARRVSP
jgi:formate/nitrite transporter FocA (FNT family)